MKTISKTLTTICASAIFLAGCNITEGGSSKKVNAEEVRKDLQVLADGITSFNTANGTNQNQSKKAEALAMAKKSNLSDDDYHDLDYDVDYDYDVDSENIYTYEEFGGPCKELQSGHIEICTWDESNSTSIDTIKYFAMDGTPTSFNEIFSTPSNTIKYKTTFRTLYKSDTEEWDITLAEVIKKSDHPYSYESTGSGFGKVYYPKSDLKLDLSKISFSLQDSDHSFAISLAHEIKMMDGKYTVLLKMDFDGFDEDTVSFKAPIKDQSGQVVGYFEIIDEENNSIVNIYDADNKLIQKSH
jgi:hypothetical protein